MQLCLNCSGVTHQAWSDAPLYFKPGLGKALGSRGEQDPVEALQIIADSSEALIQLAEQSKPIPSDMFELLKCRQPAVSVDNSDQ